MFFLGLDNDVFQSLRYGVGGLLSPKELRAAKEVSREETKKPPL